MSPRWYQPKKLRRENLTARWTAGEEEVMDSPGAPDPRHAEVEIAAQHPTTDAAAGKCGQHRRRSDAKEKVGQNNSTTLPKRTWSPLASDAGR